MELIIKKDGDSNIESIKYVDDKGLFHHYKNDVAKYIISKFYESIKSM